MNRLKNLVNNDQGKTLNTAEQRFARIQGLVVLFGETKRYCDQNINLVPDTLDQKILPNIESKIEKEYLIKNTNRAVGTRISNYLLKKFGYNKLLGDSKFNWVNFNVNDGSISFSIVLH